MEASVEYLMLFFGPTFLYHETFFTLILLFWKCSTKNVVLNTQLLHLLVLQQEQYSFSLPFTVKTNAWVFYLSCVTTKHSTSFSNQLRSYCYSENIFLPHPFPLNCVKAFPLGFSVAVTHCLLGVISFSVFLRKLYSLLLQVVNDSIFCLILIFH